MVSPHEQRWVNWFHSCSHSRVQRGQDEETRSMFTQRSPGCRMSDQVQVKQTHCCLTLALNFFHLIPIFSAIPPSLAENGTTLHFQERSVLLLAALLSGPSLLGVLSSLMFTAINLLFCLPRGLLPWQPHHPSTDIFAVHVQKLSVIKKKK